jgi:hypothetical protein
MNTDAPRSVDVDGACWQSSSMTARGNRQGFNTATNQSCAHKVQGEAVHSSHGPIPFCTVYEK